MKGNPLAVFRSYDRLLNRLIARQLAASAVEFYIHHPNQAFAREFNILAAGVNGDRIDRVFGNTKRVLGRFIADGGIQDGRHLHLLAVGILRTLGRHHEAISWHQDHPQQQMANEASVIGDVTRQPLFAIDVDVALVARSTMGPADEIRRKELFATLLRAARQIGLLHVRAAQIVSRYEFEHGKAHGAYVHLARFAILDDSGRVVGLQSWRSSRYDHGRPDSKVIRRLRTIHLAAQDKIREIARRLEFDLPPGA